jgi:hypothetical protein
MGCAMLARRERAVADGTTPDEQTASQDFL